MSKRRTVLAAVFALTALGGGIAASGIAQAQHSPSGTVPRTSTTEKPIPNTLRSVCIDGQSGVAGGQCTTYTTLPTRTKNAALPKNGVVTTTTAAVKPPANAASWKVVNGVAVAMTCNYGYMLKAGACVAVMATTTTTIARTTTTIARVKNGIPKPAGAPATNCAAGGTCSNTRK